MVVVGTLMGAGGIALTLMHLTTPVGTALRAFAIVGLTVSLVWVSVIDARSHRLPDRIVLPTIAVLAAIGVLIAWADGDWPRVGRAAFGAFALFAAFLVLGMIVTGSLGGGDVKLSAVIGGAAAWCGWMTFALAVVLAFVVAGIVSLGLVLTRRLKREERVAFGPALCFGLGAAMLLA